MEFKLPDLTIDLQTADTVLLTQDAGCGEIETVGLHISQVRYLAEVTGLLEPSKLSIPPEGLKKRLERAIHPLAGIYDCLASDRPQAHPLADDLLLVIERLGDAMEDFWPALETQEKPSPNQPGLQAAEFHLSAQGGDRQ